MTKTYVKTQVLLDDLKAVFKKHSLVADISMSQDPNFLQKVQVDIKTFVYEPLHSHPCVEYSEPPPLKKVTFTDFLESSIKGVVEKASKDKSSWEIDSAVYGSSDSHYSVYGSSDSHYTSPDVLFIHPMVKADILASIHKKTQSTGAKNWTQKALRSHKTINEHRADAGLPTLDGPIGEIIVSQETAADYEAKLKSAEEIKKGQDLIEFMHALLGNAGWKVVSSKATPPKTWEIGGANMAYHPDPKPDMGKKVTPAGQLGLDI